MNSAPYVRLTYRSILSLNSSAACEIFAMGHGSHISNLGLKIQAGILVSQNLRDKFYLDPLPYLYLQPMSMNTVHSQKKNITWFKVNTVPLHLIHFKSSIILIVRNI